MTSVVLKKGQVPLVLVGLVVLAVALFGISGNHSSSTASSPDFYPSVESNHDPVPISENDQNGYEMTATQVDGWPQKYFTEYIKVGQVNYMQKQKDYISEDGSTSYVQVKGITEYPVTISAPGVKVEFYAVENNMIYGKVIEAPAVSGDRMGRITIQAALYDGGKPSLSNAVVVDNTGMRHGNKKAIAGENFEIESLYKGEHIAFTMSYDT